MDGVRVRRAGGEDAAAIAEVWLASYRATYDFPRAHSDEEVRQYVREVLVPTRELWVAVAPEAGVVALLALTFDEVDQLNVAPGWTNRGIGSRLMTLAKERRPDGLTLYTFEVNTGARRFYERHGFVEIERGDGSGNEERQPDVRYAWRPEDAEAGSAHRRPR